VPPNFINIRPKARALDIIDAVRHPSCAKYARQSIELGAKGISAPRENGWILGYQRFGDEFERALGNVSTAKNPRAFHARLEKRLDDPWKLLGVRLSELSAGTQAAWHLVRSQSSVVALYVTRGPAPEGYDRFLEWRYGDAGYPSSFGGTWIEGRLGRHIHRVTATQRLWTMPHILDVMASGRTFADFEALTEAGLLSPRQFHAVLHEGVPLEYALEA